MPATRQRPLGLKTFGAFYSDPVQEVLMQRFERSDVPMPNLSESDQLAWPLVTYGVAWHAATEKQSPWAFTLGLVCCYDSDFVPDLFKAVSCYENEPKETWEIDRILIELADFSRYTKDHFGEAAKFDKGLRILMEILFEEKGLEPSGANCAGYLAGWKDVAERLQFLFPKRNLTAENLRKRAPKLRRKALRTEKLWARHLEAMKPLNEVPKVLEYLARINPPYRNLLLPCEFPKFGQSDAQK